MMLEVGQILQNRYRVVSMLGQGGMGAVYRAWDARLDVPVALKEMIPQPGLDSRKLAQLQQQFQREAKILARLNHPHPVGVTDFFVQAGSVYLVMKFIEGKSLAHLIERQGALSEEWGLELAEQLRHCAALGVQPSERKEETRSTTTGIQGSDRWTSGRTPLGRPSTTSGSTTADRHSTTEP